MIGILMDFKVSELKKEFGEDFKSGYEEIEMVLKYYDGKRITNDFYIINCSEDTLPTIYKIVREFKSIDWFRKCIYNLKIFRMKDYSDFTNIIKTEDKKEER